MIPALLTLAAVLAAGHACAQAAFTGRVSDARTDEPLAGATVYAEEAGIGTLTDADGAFRLPVSGATGEQELVVSYLGYAPRRFAARLSETLEVRLEASSESIEEVVVTALGLRRENAELGYALQAVDGAAIADVPATNLLDNLAGQVAGVSVVTGASGVGSTSLISIRGEASFTGNTPLLVVDGVPVDNRSVLNVTDEAARGFQEVDFGGGVPEVSPFDVERISVLKGPAAAALYGARAANGAIVIETKDGAGASGLGIEVNQQTTLERPFRLPALQNAYGQGNGGAFAYRDGAGGGVNDGITFSYGPRLDAGLELPQFDSPVALPDGRVVRAGDLALYDDEAIAPTPFVARPDNLRDLYRTGVTALTNVALAQSFGRGDYRLSLTDLRSDNYIPGVDLERGNLAARLRFRPTEKLTVSAGATYVRTRSDNRPASGYGSENVNYSTVAWLGRSTDVESLRDYWQPGLEGRRQFSFNASFFDNPFFILHENRNALTRDRGLGFLTASYRLSPKLELRLRTGLDRSAEVRELRRNFSTNRFREGAYAEQALTFSERNTDLLLTYEDRVGDALTLAVSAGANRLDQRYETEQTQALALSTPGVFRLSNAAIPLEYFGELGERRINSLYALARLGWRDQLFVDLTGRQDYSSALVTPESADGGEAGFFYPSAAASWVASRALELPDLVSFLQVRASAAQVGNDTDPYRTTAAFAAGTPVGGLPSATAQLELPAEGLRPERVTAYEVGVDLRLLDDLLGLDVTAYSQLNSDQILALPTPISSGYASRVVNGGAVRATGLEAVVALRGARLGRDLRLDGRLNFTLARAEVASLPEGTTRTTLAYSRVYDNPGQTVYFIAEEGGRIGDMYGTGYLRNEAGQTVVNAQGQFIADNTLRLLGNYTPDFTVGLTGRLSWRAWSLDYLVDWRQGGEVVSTTQALAGYSGQLALTEDRPAEGIVVPGVVNVGTAGEPSYVPNETPISPEAYYIAFYNREHEENNTLDATFVKLRELRLGRRLAPASTGWLQHVDLALIGRNLAAWSPITDFDPEQFAVQGQRFVRGVEDMSYPTARSVGLSLSARF